MLHLVAFSGTGVKVKKEMIEQNEQIDDIKRKARGHESDYLQSPSKQQYLSTNNPGLVRHLDTQPDSDIISLINTLKQDQSPEGEGKESL